MARARVTAPQRHVERETVGGAELPTEDEMKARSDKFSAEARALRESDAARAEAATAAMAEHEERQTEALLRMANSATWAQQRIAQAKAAGRDVIHEQTSEIWQWSNGIAEFRLEGLQELHWVDSEGKEQSNVLLRATVLDGESRAAKDMRGRSVLLPTPYLIARRVAVTCGYPVDRNHPPSAALKAMYFQGEEGLLLQKFQTILAYVECGPDKLPVYINVRGGKRMCRNASITVL